MDARAIVLYDGTCGFCSAAVRWLMAADTHAVLRFAALESDAAKTATAPFGGPPAGVDSIIVVTDRELLVRSDAALELARRLPAPWPVLGSIASLIPRTARDALYDLIARNRHRFPAPLSRRRSGHGAVRRTRHRR